MSDKLMPDLMPDMDDFAAKYLLHAFQALGIANDSVSESDFKDFASSLRHKMKLWIGDEETIRHRLEMIYQVDHVQSCNWRQQGDALQKKLKIDCPSDLPF